MLWRLIHDTLKWLWPAIFAGLLGIATLAVAASQVWPDAKAATGDVYTKAIGMLHFPATWSTLATIFFVWLAAFIWSGMRISKRGDVDALAVAPNFRGGTHYHNYQTLNEKLAQIPAAQPVQIHPDNAHHGHVSGAVLAKEEGLDNLEAIVITGLHNIYVGYIIVSAGALHIERRVDFAIVGYNGSTDTIRVADVVGRIRAGVVNLRDYEKLQTPLFQGVLNAAPGKEFVLQMRQDVSFEQAQKYLDVLENKKDVGLDLRQLDIIVSSVENPEKSMRLPLWDGVNLRRRDDIVSSRNTIMSLDMAIESNVALSLQVTRSDGTTEGHDAN